MKSDKKKNAQPKSAMRKREAKTVAPAKRTQASTKGLNSLKKASASSSTSDIEKSAGKRKKNQESLLRLDAPSRKVEVRATESSISGVRDLAVDKKPSKSVKKPRKDFIVPPVLLEGDLSASSQVGGPGSRYALTAETLIPQVTTGAGELPESYGTKNVFLAARDPHWLFVSWDLSNEQQRDYNSRSRTGRLMLRVFANGQPKPILPEIEVHPESKSWFVHVPDAERLYYAELGYFDNAGTWISIAASKSTFTPPEAPTNDVAAEFATIPPEISFQQIVEVVQQFVAENEPLLEAVMRANVPEASSVTAAASAPEATPRLSPPVSMQIQQPPTQAPVAPKKNQDGPAPSARVVSVPTVPQANGLMPARSFRAELPVRVEKGDDWTPDQAKAVARLINVDSYRRVWMGSLEITELIRRRLQEEVSSIAAAELARSQPQPDRGPMEVLPSSAGLIEAPRKERGFWFKVNAELIIYGATEPDATVTIAERKIKLRPDGSFSFRFSLPDGRYRLPAVAISHDGYEGREARLEFSRTTEYHGEVEAHPQDATLRPPAADNVA